MCKSRELRKSLFSGTSSASRGPRAQGALGDEAKTGACGLPEPRRHDGFGFSVGGREAQEVSGGKVTTWLDLYFKKRVSVVI